MKSYFFLFFLPFLCVKCCPWDNCEGADIFCDEILPVLPELANAIPYENGDGLLFRFDDNLEPLQVDVFRNEGLISSQSCQDEILTILQNDATDPEFRISISTDKNGESQLWFSFSFTSLRAGIFSLGYDEMGATEVSSPLELRLVADTILAGTAYQNVEIVRVPQVSETGAVSSFYYSKDEGLLRVERLNAPAFFRVN